VIPVHLLDSLLRGDTIFECQGSLHWLAGGDGSEYENRTGGKNCVMHDNLPSGKMCGTYIPECRSNWDKFGWGDQQGMLRTLPAISWSEGWV
jgi:hypothetical protein